MGSEVDLSCNFSVFCYVEFVITVITKLCLSNYCKDVGSSLRSTIQALVINDINDCSRHSLT